jgi:chromate transporter
MVYVGVYLELMIKFLKISTIGFGGGWSIINLLEKEFVEDSKWLSEEEFSRLVAIAASTPGPIALNAATYIGYKVAGVLGSIIATFSVVLPPYVVILLIAYGLSYYIDNIYVRGFINGLKAVVIGLFSFSTYSVFRNTFMTLNTPHQLVLLLILTLLFVIMVYRFKLDVLLAVIVVGMLGVLATVFRIW